MREASYRWIIPVVASHPLPGILSSSLATFSVLFNCCCLVQQSTSSVLALTSARPLNDVLLPHRNSMLDAVLYSAFDGFTFFVSLKDSKTTRETAPSTLIPLLRHRLKGERKRSDGGKGWHFQWKPKSCTCNPRVERDADE